MIIDVHRHLVVKGTVQGAYIQGASKSFSMMYNKANKTNLTPRQYIDDVIRKETDDHADNIIAEMDVAGVDVTVIFAVDYGLLFGEPPIHIFDQNKLYSDIAKRHAGRMIPFMAIDPRRKGALKHCEQAYHEWGMKGFKLHAGTGYMPDDPVCNWVYEKASEWKIPIMCHTGGAPSVALRWENSRRPISSSPTPATSAGGRKRCRPRPGCPMSTSTCRCGRSPSARCATASSRSGCAISPT
jgi:predicted TIM-barrel fold metal-dependent hydrolase